MTCGGSKSRVSFCRLMQAMGSEEGQGSMGQHSLGDDGSGADDGGNRLGNHVGNCRGRVRDDQGSMDRANSVVSDDAGEASRGSGSDGQDGDENSLWEKQHVRFLKLLLPSFLFLSTTPPPLPPNSP